jgi:hypothetical protein
MMHPDICRMQKLLLKKEPSDNLKIRYLENFIEKLSFAGKKIDSYCILSDAEVNSSNALPGCKQPRVIEPEHDHGLPPLPFL